MGQAVGLLLLHSRRLFRECLQAALQARGVEVVASGDPATFALTGDDAHAVVSTPTEVVIIEAARDHRRAAELVRQLLEQSPPTKIVLLVGEQASDAVAECAAAGAQGILPEESSLADLVQAVERVRQGEVFCCPELAHAMVRQMARRERDAFSSSRSALAKLTPREREVLCLVAKRLSNKQIARSLFVSPFTVKNHVHNILEKLQVADRQEAVELAHRKQWLEGPLTAST